MPTLLTAEPAQVIRRNGAAADDEHLTTREGRDGLKTLQTRKQHALQPAHRCNVILTDVTLIALEYYHIDSLTTTELTLADP